MKKILSIIFAMIMILSLSLPCFAMSTQYGLNYEQFIKKSDDTCTIDKNSMNTIKQKTWAISDTYVAQKLFDAFGFDVEQNSQTVIEFSKVYPKVQGLSFKTENFTVDAPENIVPTSTENAELQNPREEYQGKNGEMRLGLFALYLGDEEYLGKLRPIFWLWLFMNG